MSSKARSTDPDKEFGVVMSSKAYGGGNDGPVLDAPVVDSFVADSDTELTFTWLAVTGATGYEVRIKKTTDGAWGSWTDVGNVLTYQFDTLDDDTEYQAQVRAYDAVPNYSNPSDVATATTQATPFNVALAASGSTITANTASATGPLTNLIDGYRHSLDGGNDRVQLNGSGQWIEIDFGTSRTINEINFISFNVNNNSASDPTLSTDGGYSSDNDLEMFYWDGSNWQSLGNVDNSMAWKQWLFTAVTTTKVRMEAASVGGGALYAMEFEVIGF